MGFIFKDTEPSPAQDSSGVRQKGDLLAPPPVVTTCRSGLAVRTCLASLAGPFLVQHHGRFSYKYSAVLFAKIRATRRAQDRRSPLTVKRTRAGHRPIDGVGPDSRSGVRGTRTAQRPAKVAHPLALGVTGASAWTPAAVAPAPPRPNFSHESMDGQNPSIPSKIPSKVRRKFRGRELC
jgi:hypothetical protein